MNDEHIIRSLRTMAWERAKGELRGMLNTFYSTSQSQRENQFEELDKAINDFIKDIESRGLQE